jgi:hypothetical protein
LIKQIVQKIKKEIYYAYLLQYCLRQARTRNSESGSSTIPVPAYDDTVAHVIFHSCKQQPGSVDFVSSEIDTGDNRQGYWNGDMNGDGLQDIIIATWSEANGREFLIYTQETSGNFSGAPWRRIEIKKDIVAFALADLRH